MPIVRVVGVRASRNAPNPEPKLQRRLLRCFAAISPSCLMDLWASGIGFEFEPDTLA